MEGKITDCFDCPSYCCRYVIIEIDKPNTWYDYHNIRWFIAHKNMSVLKKKNEWYLKFLSDCEFLNADNACDIYEKRPVMCRRHKIDTCEISDGEEAYEIEFKTLEYFDEWLKELRKNGGREMPAGKEVGCTGR